MNTTSPEKIKSNFPTEIEVFTNLVSMQNRKIGFFEIYNIDFDIEEIKM
jgi:hypothetical protein